MPVGRIFSPSKIASPLALLAGLRRSGRLDEATFAALWLATAERLGSPNARAKAVTDDEATAEEEEEEAAMDEEDEDEDEGEQRSKPWSAAEQASFRRHVLSWPWGGYPETRPSAKGTAKQLENIAHWQRLTASVAAECGTQPRPILSSYSKACKLRRGTPPWKDVRRTRDRE